MFIKYKNIIKLISLLVMIVICITGCDNAVTNQINNENILNNNICNFKFGDKVINFEVKMLETDNKSMDMYSPKCEVTSTNVRVLDIKNELVNQVSVPYSADLVFDIDFNYIGDVVGTNPIYPFGGNTKILVTSKKTNHQWNLGFWTHKLYRDGFQFSGIECITPIYKKGDSGRVSFTFPYNSDLVEDGTTMIELLIYHY